MAVKKSGELMNIFEAYIAGGAVLMAVLLLFFEFRRKNNASISRMLITAAGCFFLYLALLSVLNTSRDSSLVLFTSHSPVGIQTNKPSRSISDLGPYLLSMGESPDSVIIYGDGLLTQLDRQILKDASSVLYIPGPLPSGIKRIYANAPWIAGHSTALHLVFADASVKKLTVQTSDGFADTLAVDSLSSNLVIKPRLSGKYLITLTGFDSLGSTLSMDEYPVIVREPTRIRLVIITDFPDPEFNFLKNHLGKAGHEVTTRTKISAEKYAWEHINTERVTTDVFGRLESFDILFTTVSALNSLSRADVETLQSQIENGLGLYVLYNEIPRSSLDVLIPGLQRSRATSLDYKGHSLGVYPYTLPNDGFRNITEFTSTTPFGTGNVTFSVISRSYPMLLSGDSADYRDLWNLTTKETIRPSSSDFITDFPLFWQIAKDRQMDIKIYHKDKFEAWVDGIPVNLTQDLRQGDLWWLTYWPVKNGWHTLTMEGTKSRDSTHFYVQESGWEYLKANEIQRQNRNLAVTSHPGASGFDLKYLWITGVLLCFVFLWLEPRL